MQLVMVGNQHQRSYGNKTMKAQNTINLGQISGEIKTWNNFIMGSKGLIVFHDSRYQKLLCKSSNTMPV